MVSKQKSLQKAVLSEVPALPAFCSVYKKGEREGAALALRIQPRASRTGPLTVIGAELKWGVRAAPVEGQANTEVVSSVARFFDTSKSKVTILHGESSRSKVLLLEALTPRQLIEVLRKAAVIP